MNLQKKKNNNGYSDKIRNVTDVNCIDICYKNQYSQFYWC